MPEISGYRSVEQTLASRLRALEIPRTRRRLTAGTIVGGSQPWPQHAELAAWDGTDLFPQERRLESAVRVVLASSGLPTTRWLRKRLRYPDGCSDCRGIHSPGRSVV
jgi:hypothetical protein